MSINIFEPCISKVSYSMEGKTALFYGSNSVGKTKQAVRFDKPYYLAFERGINAISGIPFAPIQEWSDFRFVVKQLIGTTMKEAKENYQTIILDTVEASALLCQDYVCALHEAKDIQSGKEGFGLWKEYEQEYWRWINKLTTAGYTVIFISHVTSRKEKRAKDKDSNGTTDKASEMIIEKIYPAGDKRSIDPICNLVDFIVYIQPNGIDEDGNEILSSAYMVNTPQYLARSRFPYMTNYLPEFTKEAFEDAIKVAVEKEEKATGNKAVTYKVQEGDYEVNKQTFEQLQEAIKNIAERLYKDNRISEYEKIIESVLGKGKKVKDTNSSQRQLLEVVLDELQDAII